VNVWSDVMRYRSCAPWKHRMLYWAALQCRTRAACCSLERPLAVSDQWNFHWPFLGNGLTTRHTAHQ